VREVFRGSISATNTLDSVGIDTSAKYIRFAEDRLAEDAKKRSAIKLDFSAGV